MSYQGNYANDEKTICHQKSRRSAVRPFLIWILIVLLAALAAGSLGFVLGSDGKPEELSAVIPVETTQVTTESANRSSTEQQLRIHAVIDKEAGVSTIPVSAPNEVYEDKISCLYLRDITVEVNGNAIPLSDAIENQDITVRDMRYFAELDAKNGFCVLDATSKNGLTRMTYSYPEFDLWTTYDLYETPDGQQHMISDLGFCAPGKKPMIMYRELPSGKPIDYENWGLDFKVTQVSPSSIQLVCTQTGGQQIGKLSIANYDLWKPTGNEGMDDYIQPTKEPSSDMVAPAIPIRMEGETEVSIDFSSLYEDLPSGEYLISFSIEDEFEPEDVPPLTKDFHNRQIYQVPFNIS